MNFGPSLWYFRYWASELAYIKAVLSNEPNGQCFSSASSMESVAEIKLPNVL